MTNQRREWGDFLLSRITDLFDVVPDNGLHIGGGGEYADVIGYFISGKLVAGVMLWDRRVSDIACTASFGGHRGIIKILHWCYAEGMIGEDSLNELSTPLVSKLCLKLGISLDDVIYKEDE